MRNWLKSCLTCFNIAIALRLAFEAVMGQAVVATTITANGCTITDAAANRDRVLMIKGMMPECGWWSKQTTGGPTMASPQDSPASCRRK
jgi:hypothetical protein